jgi:neurofibromin 1
MLLSDHVLVYVLGFRHPVTNTVSRTIRVLNMLLVIVAKSTKRDKFEVTPQSVPYLAGWRLLCSTLWLHLTLCFSSSGFSIRGSPQPLPSEAQDGTVPA